MTIRWSPAAVADLQAIRAYIAQDRPAAANKVARRIKESILRLEDFPLSGRLGRVPGTHEMVIPGTSFIAVYRIHGDEVQIATILHGKQLWPKSI